MKKDALITFIVNDNQFEIEEKIVFSLPYSRIISAENFCNREGLDYCYLGYRNNDWVMQVTDKNVTHSIRITPTGVDDNRYAYSITN